MKQHHDLQKFGTLLSLYVAQSIPMSFFSTVVPVIMRQEEYSLESIGYIQLVKLPWIFKFLWAPLVDRHAKNRDDYKRWIILSEIFYAMVIFAISFLNLQTDFTTIMVLMVIAFTASATQDIATDAFAILSLSRDERGFGNSMQSSGSFLGTLLGSGVMLIIYHYLGWQMLLISLALCVYFALIPLRRFRYRIKEKENFSTKKKVSLKDVASFFRQPGIIKHVLLLMIFYSGIIGILTMIKPFLVDVEFSVIEIGLMSGVYGTGVAVLVSLLIGHSIRKIGRKKVMTFVTGIMMLASAFFYYMTLSGVSTTKLFIAIALIWGAYGGASVIVYTIAMDKVRKNREGTDFTIQIVITHLSSLIIAVLSGKLADAIGYKSFFGIEGILCIIVAITAFFIYKERKEENAHTA